MEKDKTENNGKKVITGLKEQLVKEYIFIHIKLKHCEYYINIVSTRCIPYDITLNVMKTVFDAKREATHLDA